MGKICSKLSFAALLSMAALCTPLAVAQPPVGPIKGFATVAQVETASIAAQIVELTNETRKQAGLKPMVPISYLATAAVGHSKEMLDLKYFSHTSPTPGRTHPKVRIQLAQGWDTRVGENIYRAKGIAPNEVAARAVAAWVKSPSHYKNLIDPTFNSIGVGIVPSGDEFVITQEFSNQTIVVKKLVSTLGSGGYNVLFQGLIREGSPDGALFINNAFKQTFQAGPDGTFELKASGPGGSQVAVSQKKGGNSYAQNLAFPIEASVK